MDDSSTPPPKLTLVPDEPEPTAIEAQSEAAAVRRLRLAIEAERVWEVESGFTP
jgi:hypothetical protein